MHDSDCITTRSQKPARGAFDRRLTHPSAQLSVVLRLLQELDKLKVKFMELAAATPDNPNTITEAQLQEALAAVGITESDTGLLDKVFSLMDKTQDGQVFFTDFVVCCSHMLTGDVKEKLNFSFR